MSSITLLLAMFSLGLSTILLTLSVYARLNGY